MKKQILLSLGLCLAFMLQAQTATTPMGNGTSSDPYQITSLNNLYWISQNASSWSSYFLQTADIDASTTALWDSGAGWTPIGYVISESSFVGFTGYYNGNNHIISGLTINRPTSTTGVGLFGFIMSATISNLSLTNVAINGGGEFVGALAGMSIGTIDSCSSTGSVTGVKGVGGLVGVNQNYSTIVPVIKYSFSSATVSYSDGKAGGLVGKNYATVLNSYATGQVSCIGTSDGNGTVGGLIGKNYGTVANSYATGAVSGYSDIGGLIGDNSSEDGYTAKIDSCFASGAVTVTIGNDAGGLVGRNYASSISHCSASGIITGNTINHSSAIGGLVGNNSENASISYSYATGSASGYGNVGGLVGSNYTGSTISNSYSRGNATGTYNNIGGLIGGNDASATITNTYSTGTPYSSGGCYGGLIGGNSGVITLTNFWDTETSSLTVGAGYNEGSFNAAGKSTAEMKTQSIFTNVGWDFSTIWAISSTENDGYPHLGHLIFPTSIEETKDETTNIAFYPNPVSDAIQVTGVEGKASLTLLDINGKLILNKEVANNEAISVSSLAQGIYLLKIVTANGTMQKKLIKK